MGVSDPTPSPAVTPPKPGRTTATPPPETRHGHVPWSVGARPFSCQSALVDDAAIVAVKGELDMATAPHLEQTIDSVIASVAARRVVVDLSEVGFFDSSALDVLVTSRRRLASREMTLHVVIPAGQPHIRKVFEITRLTEPLAVVETLAEAIARETQTFHSAGLETGRTRV